MPQMMPMNWMLLLLLFFIIFLIFNIMNYFIFSNKMNMFMNMNKKMIKKMNWKW